MELSRIHIVLILLMTLLLVPLHLQANASEVYTVQTGSFTQYAAASDQHDTLLKGLGGKDLDHLRVEEVGKFYTVRVGRFIDHTAAEEFLRAGGPQFANAVIIKAQIRDERIVKQPSRESEPSGQTDTHSVRPDGSVILAMRSGGGSYTIQAGSYTALPDAIEQYDRLLLGLTGLDGITADHLRIEKIGEFYTVRVGKFSDYIGAQEFLQATRSQLSGAIILKAYIKKERIIKSHSDDLTDDDADTAEEQLPAAQPETTAGDLTPQAGKPSEKAEIPSDEPSDELVDAELYRKSEREEPPGMLSRIRGKVYISDYYSKDDDDFDLHVATARVNLYKSDDEYSGFYFEFDGKIRKKIVEGDLRGYVPRYKVDEAWLGYAFPGRQLRVIGGRQYIQELYNTDIDGLNVKYSFKNGLGMGVFGGYAPDKFDDSLNDDYRTVGLYGFLSLTDHKVSLGYEYLTYNGEPDREYFSIRAYSKLSKKVAFNGLSSVNKNQITDNYEVETANANLSYSYSRNLRFNVFGNYYRTIKYYESSKFYYEFSDTDENFLLDTNSQTRAGLRVDYTIVKGLKVYGSGAYQHRDLDNEDSTRFTGGIRKYDLYGFDLSGRYTYIDNYSSRDHEYNVEIYRNIMKKFDVSVYASYEETKLDLENAFTSGARTYGTSLYWPFTKKVYLTMFAEYIEEEDYHSTSVFGQLGYKIAP